MSAIKLKPGLLVDQKIAALQRFIGSISVLDSLDADVFQDTVIWVTDNKVIKRSEIEGKFYFNKSTVSRWTNGKSLPSKVVRQEFIKWATEKSKNKLDKLQEEYI